MADICAEAGDAELAGMIRRHAELAERRPAEAAGGVTLIRRDGSRVPLADVSRHVRFSDTGTTSSGNRAADLAAAARGLARVQALCDDTARASDREPLSTEEELDLFFDGFTWAEFAGGDDDCDDDDQDQD